MNGIIHSFQSLGAVDGPGLRYVVFMQGCPLRCAYCHNPDTWDTAGKEYSADEVFERVLRCKPYFAKNGGVTVSGGEPLMQWKFVSELFQRLHEAGINTALDTSGIGNLDGAREVLDNTDLAICDLKFAGAEDYSRYCKGSMSAVAAFLELTETMGVPLWVRHVAVPNLTDSDEYILKIAALAARYSNLQRLELLPFRKICVTKYAAMGIGFPLSDYDECSDAEIQRLYKTLINSGIPRSLIAF